MVEEIRRKQTVSVRGLDLDLGGNPWKKISELPARPAVADRREAYTTW